MIPAAVFGLVSLSCIVIDQSADISDSALGTLTSLYGRIGLTICVMAGDLATIGVTVYRYHCFVNDKNQHEHVNGLTEHIISRHSSTMLEVVV